METPIDDMTFHCAMELSSDMDIDTTEVTDGVIELKIFPPKYDEDIDKMVQSDALRLKIRLPVHNWHPGWYLSNDGTYLFRAPAYEPRATPSESVDRASRNQHRSHPYRPEPKPQLVLRQDQIDAVATVLEAYNLKALLASRHALSQSAPPIQTCGRIPLSSPEPVINPSMLPRPMSVMCSVPPRPRTGEAGTSTNSIRESDRPSKLSIEKVSEASALYVTSMSFGRRRIEDKINAAMEDDEAMDEEDDDDSDEEPDRGCRLGIDTGSSLSWVYEEGYKQLVDPREDGVPTQERYPVIDWNKTLAADLRSDFKLAKDHSSISFPSPHRIADSYAEMEILEYADNTLVVPVPFSDAVTFHNSSLKDEQVFLKFSAALAVNRLLMVRDGYDGILGLSPKPNRTEKTIQPVGTPFLKQLYNSNKIKSLKFYIIFGHDWSEESLLSLGGIKRHQSRCYRWSPWMQIITNDSNYKARLREGDGDGEESGEEDEQEVTQDEDDEPAASVEEPRDLTWSLYFDSITIHNREGQVIDTLTLSSEEDGKEMHFDTGCSLSHYEEPVLEFLVKNKLLLLDSSPDSWTYYVDWLIAKTTSVVFHFKSGCLQKSGSIELPGTIFGESDTYHKTVQDRTVALATVTHTGRLSPGINVWGNKQMRGMSFGFDSYKQQLRFGSKRPVRTKS